MSEKKQIATRDAYGKILVELGKEFPNIIVMDADLSVSTKTCGFCKAFPERFFNMGVAEQDMMGVAAGMAATGKTVFVSTFAVFATGRCWDQIRVSIAYPRLNVKIVATHSGITTGEDGVTHQANEDIAIMRAIPNMTVIVPSDAVETEAVIRHCAVTQGPTYVRLSRPKTDVINETGMEFIVGKARQMKEGKDLTIIACGLMVARALDAAQALEKDGISARVINMHTIKPIDREAVRKCAEETGAIVTVEEHNIIGGLGGAVAEVLVEDHPVPVARVGIRDMFAESGKPDELLEKYGLTASEIVKAAKNVLGRKTA